MSKGPRIKPTVKRVIVWEAVKDRNKPRRQVMVELQNIIESMGEIVPAEETLEKLISQARNHPVSDLDAPWSVGCLAKYDMPPDALPIVMKIYEGRLREEEQHFTIREALWIARLHKIIDDPIVLERFASAYALRDQVDWILNSPVYTRGFDISVIRYMNKQLTGADIAKFPGIINPLPAWGREEEEELKKKLRQKGYTLG
jgi:hypothetical protein